MNAFVTGCWRDGASVQRAVEQTHDVVPVLQHQPAPHSDPEELPASGGDSVYPGTGDGETVAVGGEDADPHLQPRVILHRCQGKDGHTR